MKLVLYERISSIDTLMENKFQKGIQRLPKDEDSKNILHRIIAEFK